MFISVDRAVCRKIARPLIVAAAVVALAAGLTACSSDDDMAGAGTPFTQALFRNYTDLSTQAASLPPAPGAQTDTGWFDWLDPFSDSGSNANDLLVKAFDSKAEIAANGTEPEPEAAPDAVAGAIRARLVRALAASKDQVPDIAAHAQTDYDCWVLYGTVPSAAAASQACKSSLDSSLVQLETAGRPAPPPAPAPVAAPPPPPPPPAPSDFTVYFNFDSWTLTAEDLTVLTDVITTARNGGQSQITIVGHTDTSGPADYNQRLSVHRANVVVEALVDMGARRAAIHASGVGENDLAVATGDGVREAKNRRAVITLQP
jgi:outer membrane protein OmpA-like peptidoglycan-associated protein